MLKTEFRVIDALRIIPCDENMTICLHQEEQEISGTADSLGGMLNDQILYHCWVAGIADIPGHGIRLIIEAVE